MRIDKLRSTTALASTVTVTSAGEFVTSQPMREEKAFVFNRSPAGEGYRLMENK
jgi:hypothetical protein